MYGQKVNIYVVNYDRGLSSSVFFSICKRRPSKMLILMSIFYCWPPSTPIKFSIKSKRPQHHEHFLWKAALYVLLNFFFLFHKTKFLFLQSLFKSSLLLNVSWGNLRGEPTEGSQEEDFNVRHNLLNFLLHLSFLRTR